MKYEKLVEQFQVIEFKDGKIYRTKSLGEVWIDSDIPQNKLDENNCFYNSISTKRMVELNYRIMRRKVK